LDLWKLLDLWVLEAVMGRFRIQKIIIFLDLGHLKHIIFLGRGIL
jgi:hypothetical protein